MNFIKHYFILWVFQCNRTLNIIDTESIHQKFESHFIINFTSTSMQHLLKCIKKTYRPYKASIPQSQKTNFEHLNLYLRTNLRFFSCWFYIYFSFTFLFSIATHWWHHWSTTFAHFDNSEIWSRNSIVWTPQNHRMSQKLFDVSSSYFPHNSMYGN